MPEHADKLSEFFQQGADARAADVNRGDNPYGLGTMENREWTAGWCATFDLDEEDDPQSNRDQPADKLEDDQP